MKTKRKEAGSKESVNWVVTVILILIAAFIILGPLYITILISVKSSSEMGDVLALPQRIHWENFVQAWKMTDYPRKFLNTFVITFVNMFFTIPLHSMLAYALTRYQKEVKLFKAVYYLLTCSLFIPFNVLMLPLVKQAANLHMDNIWGIIVLYFLFGTSMNVFLYSGHIKTMPMAIEEAAIIDGANPWQLFFAVIFPVLKPMNATVAILAFISTWNDFLMPLVILTKPEQQTLQLAQYVFKSEFSTQYNLAFASYVLVLVPVVIVYIFCQQWVIAGVTEGAIKS